MKLLYFLFPILEIINNIEDITMPEYKRNLQNLYYE
jgi:hypothetical protein